MVSDEDMERETYEEGTLEDKQFGDLLREAKRMEDFAGFDDEKFEKYRKIEASLMQAADVVKEEYDSDRPNLSDNDS